MNKHSFLALLWLPIAKETSELIIILSCLFSILLFVSRVVYTGNLTFAFLLWNLFLAYIPYAITTQVERSERLKRPEWKFVAGVFLWLLFIPNSFYILTDLFHLHSNRQAPLWFDLALIFSFAWNGLLLGILSLRQMEKLIHNRFRFHSSIMFIYFVFWLIAFGIYIGRYLRYNSWNIITSPFPLASDIMYLFAHPLRNRLDWGMIFCYSFFMTIVYFSLKHVGKQFR